MTEKLITNKFKTHSINQLIESISEPSNTSYYAFYGNHLPFSTGTIPSLSNSLKDIKTDVFQNMISGKKLDDSNFKLMIPKHPWVANTVYDMYDDIDSDLFQKDFFVVVDETAYFHVYKCLYNANGGYSTVQPDFSDHDDDSLLFENNDDYYETSDGYQWKYMYSVDSVTYDKFASESYIPIVANTIVQDRASAGSIDVIKVTTHGRNYNNYLEGVFLTTDLRLSGNNRIYRLSSSANTQTNFYSNTILYISEGTGKGEYRRISNSYLYDGGTSIVIDSSFSVLLDASTRYIVAPEVKITGSGNETITAEAIAIVNTNASNSIHKITMLNPGLNYSYAIAEILKGSDSVSVTDAEIRPILPPSKGHGFDPYMELGATSLGIYVKFSNNESNTISTNNDFRQFGILYDPKFSNVEISTYKISTNTIGYDGLFQAGETVYQFKKIQLNGNVSVNSGNAIIVGDSIDFTDLEIFPDTFIYITDTANNEHFISGVNYVVNSSSIELTSNISWTSNTALIYFAKISANAVVSNVVNSSSIRLNETDSNFIINRNIIGANSFAIANVVGIELNERFSNNATFSTFKETLQLNGIVTFGAFQEDEYVYQQVNDTIIAFGYVQQANSTQVELTNTSGVFLTTVALVGNTSSASMTINNIYNKEIDPISGNILYLQNHSAVSRSETTSEEIRIIINF